MTIDQEYDTIPRNVHGFTNTKKIKEEAAQWLLRIDNARLNAHEIKALRAWMNTSDVHRSIALRMSKTWNNMDVLQAIIAPPQVRTWAKRSLLATWLLSPFVALLWAIDRSIFYTAHWFKTCSRRRLGWGGVGCAMCLALGLGVLLNPGVLNQAPFDQATTTHFSTGLGEQRSIKLTDGSVLSLNSRSSVTLDYAPGYRRIHLLAGEAHFNVFKDYDRPFEVYVDDRLIRATGTAFSVYRLDDSINVMVSEGSVELAIIDEATVSTQQERLAEEQRQSPRSPSHRRRSVLNKTTIRSLGQLEAGQSINIPLVNYAAGQNGKGIVQIDAQEITRKLSWLDGKLVFAGESLQEVVDEISRHTAIKIDVPDPALKRMRIGGHFQTGETAALFTVLESGFGIEVKKISKHHVELQAKK